ncbi:MAG TPA: hypothetical protein O0X32_02045, partial [Methanocorpusculum sp.]|nr:hypothetical protein [Methanocorpusculum sp.]
DKYWLITLPSPLFFSYSKFCRARNARMQIYDQYFSRWILRIICIAITKNSMEGLPIWDELILDTLVSISTKYEIEIRVLPLVLVMK